MVNPTTRLVITIILTILASVGVGVGIGFGVWGQQPDGNQVTSASRSREFRVVDWIDDSEHPNCKINAFPQSVVGTSLGKLNTPWTEVWTVSMWARPSTPAIKHIANKLGKYQNALFMMINTSIRFELEIPETGDIKALGSSFFDDAKTNLMNLDRQSWNHYAIVRRQDALEFYINGELLGTILPDWNRIQTRFTLFPETLGISLGTPKVLSYRARYCPEAIDSSALMQMIQSDSFE